MTFSTEQLEQYRQRTFRLTDGLQLKSAADAVQYVNERGFVYFWPIKDVPFPSLWTAVVGNRPVSDDHDHPGHVTWGWKDQMLDQRQWYYAKILRGKATMIALDTIPYFYALSENYGDPEQDYLIQYEDGLLSREAKLIYETLLREGAQDTVNLRRLAGMTSKASNSVFNRVMTELQKDFKILPVGIAEAGAWRYSFIYDLLHRYYPEIPAQAREIKRAEARRHLAQLYFNSMGVATEAEFKKLFQWSNPDSERTLTALVEAGELQRIEGAQKRLNQYLVPALLSQ